MAVPLRSKQSTNFHCRLRRFHCWATEMQQLFSWRNFAVTQAPVTSDVGAIQCRMYRWAVHLQYCWCLPYRWAELVALNGWRIMIQPHCIRWIGYCSRHFGWYRNRMMAETTLAAVHWNSKHLVDHRCCQMSATAILDYAPMSAARLFRRPHQCSATTSPYSDRKNEKSKSIEWVWCSFNFRPMASYWSNIPEWLKLSRVNVLYINSIIYNINKKWGFFKPS